MQLESVGGVDAAKRVMADEPFDLVFLASDAIDQLTAAGKLAAHSKVDLADSTVAMAVRAGAVQPDISSAQAVRHAVVSARSIGYSTGPSGIALARLFDAWGIAAQLQGRIVQAPPGVAVGTLVARGEVELGFQQLSELIHLDGITVLGKLPPDIQITTTFSAAVTRTSAHTQAAQALLQFLVSDETADTKRREGMAPAAKAPPANSAPQASGEHQRPHEPTAHH